LLEIAHILKERLDRNRLAVGERVALSGKAGVVYQDVGVGGDSSDGAAK